MKFGAFLAPAPDRLCTRLRANHVRKSHIPEILQQRATARPRPRRLARSLGLESATAWRGEMETRQTSLKWWGFDEANHFASYSLSTQIVCDAFDGIDSSELRTSPVEDL